MNLTKVYGVHARYRVSEDLETVLLCFYVLVVLHKIITSSQDACDASHSIYAPKPNPSSYKPIILPRPLYSTPPSHTRHPHLSLSPSPSPFHTPALHLPLRYL